MCGIIAVLGSTENPQVLRKRLVQLSKRLRHRGPDWNGICVQLAPGNVTGKCNVLAHERLAIVDPHGQAQPLYNNAGNIALTINAEIYNHKELESQLTQEHEFKTRSDCEVIVHMYEELGTEVVKKLDGMFAFVLSDQKTGDFLAARDHIGICSMYVGTARDGSLWFASELKALHDSCETFQEFPPGCFMTNKSEGFQRWYNPSWFSEVVPTKKLDLAILREKLEQSVVKRLMTDVPYGVLLSGGLDSSLVASIAARHASHRVEDAEQSLAWWPRLHSFSIGLPGSPDLKAAREVADFLGTVHHEFSYSIQEGIDAVADVIYHIETYDVTTIRASVPMYLLSRRIKAMGVKMVLSGEGADEIFGGYLYFHKAPSSEKFHVETCHKLKALSKYDCLRANKSTMAWGIEARVPFLDQKFLEEAMAIDPSEKMISQSTGKIEKYILRKAFDDEKNPYLPKHILWRQKEQFSDGVGYTWIDSLKQLAEEEVSDEEMGRAQHQFPFNTPTSKEAFLYRSLFRKYFPEESAATVVPGGPSVACSTPAAIEWDLEWSKNADPSGRAIKGVHFKAN